MHHLTSSEAYASIVTHKSCDKDSAKGCVRWGLPRGEGGYLGDFALWRPTCDDCSRQTGSRPKIEWRIRFLHLETPVLRSWRTTARLRPRRDLVYGFVKNRFGIAFSSNTDFRIRFLAYELPIDALTSQYAALFSPRPISAPT